MLRLLVTLISVASVTACASPDKGFGESTEVQRSDFDSLWPLTVDSAVITCDEGVVSITVDGKTDLIERTTGTRSVTSSFSEIWSPDESQPNGRMSLEPIVERGESLCD